VSAYYVDEASMELPGGLEYVDRSVNLVEVPGADGTQLALMIERAPIPVGKSLREVVLERREKSERELRGYTILDEGERVIDDVPALTTRARWRHAKGPIYNAEVHVALDGRAVTFAASCRWQHAEACDRWLEALVSSIRFRTR
jgi:hypothetical protein